MIQWCFSEIMQYPKPKEGFSFGGFLSHMLAFGAESNQAEQPASLPRSCCNLSRCLLEQVRPVLEQVFPGEEEGFLCSWGFCVQFLYWPPVFKVATKKQQLPRVLCGGEACCSSKQMSQVAAVSLFWPRECLPRENSSLNPNQPFRERSEGSFFTSVFFSLCTIDISASTASNMQLNHVPYRRLKEPVEMCSASWKCSSRTCSVSKIADEAKSLKKVVSVSRLNSWIELVWPEGSAWHFQSTLLAEECTVTPVAQKGFLLLDSFARLSSLVWISSPLVLVAVPIAREREGWGLSHCRRPRFSWAPGNLQLPETACRASLACGKDTSVIPALCPSLSFSAYKGGSQASTLPVLFPEKVFHSEKCLGAEVAGFHPGSIESCTDGRVEGEVIFTSHCLVCTVWDLTQLCLWLPLTGAQPSFLPLNLSRTMCTHWAEGRTSHHKYSRRQLATISHHAINNHVLQLLTVPLWSYLDSEVFLHAVYKFRSHV